MTAAVLSGFVLAAAAPWLTRAAGSRASWVMALIPLAVSAYLLRFVAPVSAGEVFVFTTPWVPALGVNLSFYLDGLSLLFALLITGIGAIVFVYTGGYLADHPRLGQMYAYLLVFMASMLGVVLADNVITLFVFWELTGLSSYFLIAFDHERESARSAALQALLVTGIGGLAMLVGLLMAGRIGGSLELSELLAGGEAITQHRWYGPILMLILLGAFTKSAQVPFHFWLPNAMEAPTPVSAYLHSATMVKAGVYLVARLSPVMGGTELWMYALTGIGAVTMVVAAWMAVAQDDLKRMLAYSTVSVLGMLVMLVGIGTGEAAEAAIVLLLVHGLYKAALFLAAGALDHETGVRRLTQLGGLGPVMPMTAAAAVVAASSMAGLPPSLGFVSKELVYEATWGSRLASLLTGVAILANACLVGVAATLALKPFSGPRIPTPKPPHEAPTALWLGPVLLAALGLLLGAWTALVPTDLLAAGMRGVTVSPIEADIALWHGWSVLLGFSAATVVGGAAIYLGRARLLQSAGWAGNVARWGPDGAYQGGLQALLKAAAFQTRWLQSGYLRTYLLTIVTVIIVLVGYTFARRGWGFGAPQLTEPRVYELTLAVLILAAALVAATSTSRLAAVAALGAAGYGIALIYVLFGALELAVTQFLVETLILVLFVVVLAHLPRFATLSSPRTRWRDAGVAVGVGGLMTVLTLAAIGGQFAPSISGVYARDSVLLGHGRNIVNVILVDFRALDTLGEITVLAVAAIGVWGMLMLRSGK